MFKQLMLSAIILLGGVAIASADPRQGPTGSGDALATADYGGVSYTTISLTSSYIPCFTGPGVWQGFIASSFSFTDPSDYMIICDTDSATGASAKEIARIAISTASMNGGAFQSGMSYKPPFPIKVHRGLTAKNNSGIINMITILWTKFGE